MNTNTSQITTQTPESATKEKPWLEAREGLEDYDISTKPISIETMKTYYSDLLKRSKNVL